MAERWRSGLIRATPEMLTDVLAVLSDAARWLRVDKGIRNQWPMVFAPGDRRSAQLAAEIEQGHVYVVYRGVEPLATVTVTPWCDPDFARGWPGGPGDALYVLRLAQTRVARREGRRLGAHLLGYAVELAASAGMGWVRLDCSRTNVALHRYYQSQGFHQVSDLAVPGRRSGALFQRSSR